MRMDNAKLKKRLFRLNFYLQSSFSALKPRFWGQRRLAQILKNFDAMPLAQKEKIKQRVDYYLQLSQTFTFSQQAVAAKNFHLKGHNSSYFLDVAALLPYFPDSVHFDYLFGDVTTVPDHPAIVKSRPISDSNDNAILLKLDSLRHFYIPQDICRYEDKKDQLVWRGAAHQPHRIRLLEQYADKPMFDLGCVAERSQGKPYHAGFLSITQQQQYRFILSIEGNDVATNLKWIMASNSLCFMTKPRYETWFMEGALIPDYHYVLLRDDYADLAEKVTYYQQNPLAAKTIIAQAQAHVQQFFDKKQEQLIQLLVLKKYFDLGNNGATD